MIASYKFKHKKRASGLHFTTNGTALFCFLSTLPNEEYTAAKSFSWYSK